MVDEARHHNRGLDEILGNAVIVNILIRMMYSCAIVDFILDELESGQSDPIKRYMVCFISTLLG